MITKKEDLINTYIKNDSGELRDLYNKKAVDLGLSINAACIVTSSRFIFTKMNHGRYGNVDHASSLDYLVSRYGPMRELTLSDLKPRTKTEFVECGNLQSALDEFESMSGFEFYPDDKGCGDRINSVRYLALAYGNNSLYRKVETEIDERQEFINVAREVTSATPNSKAAVSFGMLYDSGKFKLVEK